MEGERKREREKGAGAVLSRPTSTGKQVLLGNEESCNFPEGTFRVGLRSQGAWVFYVQGLGFRDYLVRSVPENKEGDRDPISSAIQKIAS